MPSRADIPFLCHGVQYNKKSPLRNSGDGPTIHSLFERATLLKGTGPREADAAFSVDASLRPSPPNERATNRREDFFEFHVRGVGTQFFSAINSPRWRS